MPVDWVQTWTWGPITNPGGFVPNYFRVPFSGAPHILGSAYLAEVSTGATGGSNFRTVSGGYQFNWDSTTAATAPTRASGGR